MHQSSLKFRKRLGLLAIVALVFIAAITFHPPSVLNFSATRPNDTRAAATFNQPIPRSLFGMHIADSDKIPWPAVEFATWRLWDAATEHGLAFWAHLERHKGEWDFRTLDHCVELAQRHGIELVYTLGITPKWAAARPDDRSAYGDGPTASEPKNMDDWRNYVRTIASRYQGKIRYYEIWNEPNLKHFFSGSVDQMVDLAREAYTILKEIDPEITVVSPSLYTDYGGVHNWLDPYFAKGGGKYADIIGAHFYIGYDKTPEDSLPLVREVQDAMAKYGLQDKPLWNTETGYGNKGENAFYSDEDSMAYVARTYILNWAWGMERFYWYAWDNRNVVTMLMVEEDNKTLEPAAIAYSEIQNWLVGSRMQNCVSDVNSTWTCELTRKQGDTAWIVWNTKGKQELAVPKKFKLGQVRTLLSKTTDLPENGRLQVGKLPMLLTKAQSN
jgi:hypothetical protein